ncbi:gamma-glutamyl-gamma-aminobutyrate hydrolase family protein [Nitrosopumilus sp.]|uniref:gamma-glutamyl-gamma-aminobutyrate hydrolase family protein n=1 Tax=Nitrosopumilus sp. TaxID=2024843 RepID=UPI003D0B3569
MKSKKIGITMRVVNAENYIERRDALSQDWTKFLESIDYVPVFIPNSSSTESFLKEMSLDGIILSGGDNIGDHKDRDETEKIILNYAISKNIPIFGVCRGMQVINKFFGGNLTTNENHIVKSHEIQLKNPTIESLFQNNEISVNSYHKNVIKEENLGQNLEVFAKFTYDETIEGFFHSLHPIIGVMWHPERTFDDENGFLLKKFFNDKFLWK